MIGAMAGDRGAVDRGAGDRGRAGAVGPLGALLAPGAGAGRDQPALVHLDQALSRAGLVVERIDFPYRRAGRRAPDRPPVLVAAVEEAALALAARLGTTTGRLLLGGRSMGGRICSLAVARGLPAAGLLLVSYPLHPPGRPDRLRSEHFGTLELPCLFVSGTRDRFGSPAELERAVRAVPGRVTTHWIEGADHSLRQKEAAVASAAVAWLEGSWGR
jgi:predicted alpha/beta-hydrolase family hydrolase